MKTLIVFISAGQTIYVLVLLVHISDAMLQQHYTHYAEIFMALDEGYWSTAMLNAYCLATNKVKL